MRLGMGVAIRLRTVLAKVTGERAGGAVPARGNPAATMPEAGSVDILPGRPDTTAKRAFEQQVDTGRTAHANRLPSLLEQFDRGLAQRDRDQLRSLLFVPCRHERMIEHGGAGTPGFAPLQVHVACLAIDDVEPGKGRLGRPGSPAARGRRPVGLEFFHDRQRIGMAFEQLDQPQVAGGDGGQGAPALQRTALPRHWQVSKSSADQLLQQRLQRSVRGAYRRPAGKRLQQTVEGCRMAHGRFSLVATQCS
ncbi:hypothetical protein D3C76_1062140 [compost metagenome]